MTYARKGLSLYLEHGGGAGIPNPDLFIGSVINIELNETKKRLEGDLRFTSSARAQQAKADVLSRDLKWLSLGRIAKKDKPVEQPDLKQGEKPTYLVTRWMPVEESLVGIPADADSMVEMRAAGAQLYPVELEQEGSEMTAQPGSAPSTPNPAPAAGDPSASPNGEARVIRSFEADPRVEQLEKQLREANVRALCGQYGVKEDRVNEFIQRGLDHRDVGLELLKSKATPAVTQPPSESVTRSEQEHRRWPYSYDRAIRAQYLFKHQGGKLDGLEGEYHQQMVEDARANGITRRSEASIFIPLVVRQTEEMIERQIRTSSSVTPNRGVETVSDQQMGLIELIRAESVGGRLGVRQINAAGGGDLTWVREDGDLTVYFVGENPAADVALSDMEWGLVTARMRSMMGGAKIPKQLMLQSSVSHVDRNKFSLAYGVGKAFDRMLFNGPGVSNQPLGVLNHVGVGTVAMGNAVPSWTKITDLNAAISDKDAEFGNLGYVTTSPAANRLRATTNGNGNAAQFIWQGPSTGGKIDGVTAIGSTQLPKTLGAGSDEHAFIYGNWNDAAIVTWNGVEVDTDPFTLMGSAQVRIFVFATGDVVVFHPESFAQGTAVKVA